MRQSLYACALASTMVLGACGGADMAGNSGSARRAEDAGSSQEGSLKGQSDPDDRGDDGDKGRDKSKDGGKDPSDLDALGKCLEKFGDHPFGDDWQGSFRKIAASVQVFGTGSAVVDREKTSKPKLTLISAAVNVMGAPKYELLNPNGWYCIKVGVNVMTKPEIKLHCNAKLADNKLNVSVLSSGSPTASIGVDVMSEVTLDRVGGCDD